MEVITKNLPNDNQVLLDEATITYVQNPDCTEDRDGDWQSLTLSIRDNGMDKFLNMKNYSSANDPHMHLKQYVTYMKAIGLSKAQIVKQCPMSLEGAAIKLYYTLNEYVQQDWKELCSTFIK